MNLETGKTVEFSYTDAEGETRAWTGEVRRVKDDHFRLDTREGPRSFRFDRVEGEIKVLKG
jgi:hypothetical protein